MMKPVVLIAFLTGCLTAAGQGVTLHAGDVFSFTFTTLAPGTVPPIPHLPEASFEASFTGDRLSNGESLRIEMFENNLLQTPFASNTVTGSVITFPSVSVSAPNSPTAQHWSDLQGVGRVTMLAGSVTISSVTFSTEISSRFFSSTFPVPEPSVTSFLLPMVTVIFGRGYLRRTNQTGRSPLPGPS